jgi:hypothetical protein
MAAVDGLSGGYMFGTLRHKTDAELLEFVLMILARGAVLTPFDVTELDQIDAEFIRRAGSSSQVEVQVRR